MGADLGKGGNVELIDVEALGYNLARHALLEDGELGLIDVMHTRVLHVCVQPIALHSPHQFTIHTLCTTSLHMVLNSSITVRAVA